MRQKARFKECDCRAPSVSDPGGDKCSHRNEGAWAWHPVFVASAPSCSVLISSSMAAYPCFMSPQGQGFCTCDRGAGRRRPSDLTLIRKWYDNGTVALH